MVEVGDQSDEEQHWPNEGMSYVGSRYGEHHAVEPATGL